MATVQGLSGLEESVARWRLSLHAPITFSAILIGGTFVPVAFLAIALAAFPTPPDSLQPAVAALGFVGSAHVFITAFFYLNKNSREVMRPRRFYFYFLPVVLMLTGSFVFFIVPKGLRYYLYALFMLSALWHHARQNVGVYSFVCRAWQAGSVSRRERLIISLGFLGAVLAYMRLYELPIRTAQVDRICYLVNLVCFLTIFAIAILISYQELNNHRHLGRLLLFLGLNLYFLPAVLFPKSPAIISFGAAHAVQYYIFLWYVIYKSPREMLAKIPRAASTTRWPLAIAIAAVWPIFVLYGLSKLYMIFASSLTNIFDGGLDSILFGVIMGWVTTHYLVDARLWKMNDPAVRAYHRASFNFLPSTVRS